VLVAADGEPNPWPGAPVAGYRSNVSPAVDPAPFVQPLVANPTRRTRRRAVVSGAAPADVRRRASDARRAVATAVPSKLHPDRAARWLEETAAAHAAYRRAHGRTAADVVAEACALNGLTSPVRAEEDVTVVCVTNRPAQLDHAIANVTRQRHPNTRFLLITNSSQFDRNVVAARLATVEGVEVRHVDEAASLGTCLNLGLDLATTRFVAKFDDDDHYGAEYLGDLVLAHRFTDAAVVGKHSHYASFEDSSVHLRFHGREFEYTSWVAGGTLLIDRLRIGSIRFEDRSLGEDGAFLASCERAGLGVYAADRFNYVQRRTGANTWDVDRATYLRRSVPVSGNAEAVADR